MLSYWLEILRTYKDLTKGQTEVSSFWYFWVCCIPNKKQIGFSKKYPLYWRNVSYFSNYCNSSAWQSKVSKLHSKLITSYYIKVNLQLWCFPQQGYLSMIVVFHQRFVSIQSLFWSKVLFHQRLSSIKGCHQIHSSIKSCLP